MAWRSSGGRHAEVLGRSIGDLRRYLFSSAASSSSFVTTRNGPNIFFNSLFFFKENFCFPADLFGGKFATCTS